MNYWMQDITIFHKTKNGYTRYNIKASFRNVSTNIRNNLEVANANKALIRVFDVKGYNNTWKVSKGDVIVNKNVLDSEIKAPLTELKKTYGENSVYQVNTIDELIFNDKTLDSHIKIGAI